jgi:hypothetical protein
MKRRRVDISIAVLVVLWVVIGRAAHADRGEASVHVQVHYGRATMGEPDAPDDTDTATFVGTGVQATYAIGNWYAFEASLGYGRLTKQTLYTVDTSQGEVDRSWHQTWAQADLGITARLGVRFIPTLHAALGVQRRTWQSGRHTEGASSDCPSRRPAPPKSCSFTLPDQAALELVGTLGAGLDYRLGDHWIAGLAVTAQRAALAEAPFHAIAATFHVSYYFYPEGAGP